MQAPTLRNILEQESYKWIFVGGKGGVGKTTTSSALSIALAQSRPKDKFLLISTDPAHNLSDAFDQKIGKDATQITSVANLYAVEISPTDEMQKIMGDLDENIAGASAANADVMGFGGLSNIFKSISGFFQKGGSNPGIDELIAFSKIVKLVDSNEYATVIFDTAPTGHTLRFLELPETAKKLLNLAMDFKQNIGGVVQMVTGMLNMGEMDIFSELNRFEPLLHSVEKVSSEFRDPSLCTFVCVCIPEFLSVYETERLCQQLAVLEMDVHNIVVNFVLDEDDSSPCAMCRSRAKMQRKYIRQIRDLYDDFNITMSPLRSEEVRGVTPIINFSKWLLDKRSFCWE